MTAGDSSDWNDLFQQDLVPQVLDHVVATWDGMTKPGPSDLEDAISIRLYSALVRSKDRQRHMFLIDYQSIEVDFDLAKEVGRKDIIFRPTLSDERIYFCLEAKRLNAVVSGVRRSLADEYVKEGMQRFVDGKYAPFVWHGGMLAYVLDGQTDRAIANVENNIRARLAELGMGKEDGLRPSSARPQDALSKETTHQRANETTKFRIHHLFVSAASPN